MFIDKVINNNLVRSKNIHGREILVMGCGLGFKKHVGDSIEEEKIEKIYTMNDDKGQNQLEEILARMPLEYIQLTNKIVDYACVSLGKTLNSNIYLTLCDHISFALERVKKNILIKNALLLEIKRFYNHEYLIGVEALQMIYNDTGIQLPVDEAGFMALHFVNAGIDSIGIGQTQEMMKVIQNIVNIVKYHFNIELNENSIHYERFITHLKFFVKRVFAGQEIDEGDEDFFLTIKNQYKKAFACVEKVQDYIKKEYGMSLTNDEMMYLTVHIHRVTIK
ncbi:MAG: PRD domain-containing protein [Lachnospiraceae bacterium]|nr:PRD domain-containing protein [Lachnospiraceae bacterium]